VRFLVDQSVDFRLALHARGEGHDVSVVGFDHPPPLPDSSVLAIAYREDRCLITNDRDFGELVFERGQPHAGVIYFRLGKVPLATMIERLDHVLAAHANDLRKFVVVTTRTVRVRR
jgi:predicted nuclease of predicted toxin-antitoxin system